MQGSDVYHQTFSHMFTKGSKTRLDHEPGASKTAAVA